jgi:hypothetical protein
MLDPRLNSPNFDRDQRNLIYLFALIMCFILLMQYAQRCYQNISLFVR